MDCTFDRFVSDYRSGKIVAKVDRIRAMSVCDDSSLLPLRYKAAHHFWKWVAFLCICGGLVALFWVPWYVGIGVTVLGLVMAPAVQKSAAGFVLDHSLESRVFYDEMRRTGVLVVKQAS